MKNEIVIETNDSVKKCSSGDLFNIDDEIYMLVNIYFQHSMLVNLQDGNLWDSELYVGELLVSNIIDYIQKDFCKDEVNVKYLGNRKIYIKE